MVALAGRQETLFNDLPPVVPAEPAHAWVGRIPIMRDFPRLAVERDEEPIATGRLEEDVERWDGMA